MFEIKVKMMVLAGRKKLQKKIRSNIELKRMLKFQMKPEKGEFEKTS